MGKGGREGRRGRRGGGGVRRRKDVRNDEQTSSVSGLTGNSRPHGME